MGHDLGDAAHQVEHLAAAMARTHHLDAPAVHVAGALQLELAVQPKDGPAEDQAFSLDGRANRNARLANAKRDLELGRVDHAKPSP